MCIYQSTKDAGCGVSGYARPFSPHPSFLAFAGIHAVTGFRINLCLPSSGCLSRRPAAPVFASGLLPD